MILGYAKNSSTPITNLFLNETYKAQHKLTTKSIDSLRPNTIPVITNNKKEANK